MSLDSEEKAIVGAVGCTFLIGVVLYAVIIVGIILAILKWVV